MLCQLRRGAADEARTGVDAFRQESDSRGKPAGQEGASLEDIWIGTEQSKQT